MGVLTCLKGGSECDNNWVKKKPIYATPAVKGLNRHQRADLLPGDWRPVWKMQIMVKQVCKTITFFEIWNQLIITFNLSLFVGLYLTVDFFTVLILWLAAILEICELGEENDV